MLSKCVMCGYDELEDVMEPNTRTLDGGTYTRLLPAEKCPGCGEFYWRSEVLQAFDIWVGRCLVKLDKLGIEGARFLEKQRKYDDLFPAHREMALQEKYREIWDNGDD